jgi:hypothetical protein
MTLLTLQILPQIQLMMLLMILLMTQLMQPQIWAL